MKLSRNTLSVAALALGALALVPLALARPSPQGDPGADMQAMMEKMQQFVRPGPQHKHLERFLGTWDIQTRLFMGAEPTDSEAGTAEYTWLSPGRWLQGRWSGSMMGMPMQGFSMLGYDNFKQSFVSCDVNTLDTAMHHAEGDMTPDGKALILYGTLDEYLTGEHDKMVKYVWRFRSPDEMTLEVHDLPIGETDTKVVETTFQRRK